MSAILIAGSRQLKGQYVYDEIWNLVHTFPSDTIVVSGMAEGVDIYAYRAAKVHNLFVKEYPVESEEWNLIGKRSGYIRNLIMGTYLKQLKGTAHLFILRDELTAGTKMMRDVCVSLGLPITWHNLDLSATDLKTPVRDWRRNPRKD